MTNLYEIYVPTVKPGHFKGKNRYFKLKHHRRWDDAVREIAGGLTIYAPAIGQWVAPDGGVFKERMIPVRIACTAEQIESIAALTAYHYGQQAVMFYQVSERAEVRHFTEATDG